MRPRVASKFNYKARYPFMIAILCAMYNINALTSHPEGMLMMQIRYRKKIGISMNLEMAM